MNFLRFLEGIRTPFFDTFFSLITHLGEETFFLIVALVLIWCVNKKYGFYILYCGLVGQAISQFLKLGFKVERPWVAYPDFKPVESAVEEAKGFSFPSGHTQIATTTYGGLALLYRRKKWLCALFSLVCLLIAFSRMYLGVHYPSDVAVSLLINLVLIVVIFYYGKKYSSDTLSLWMRIFGVLLIAVLFLYSYLETRNSLDNTFFSDSVDFAAKILGATIAFSISWHIDEKYIKFETSGPWHIQIFKILFGTVILLAIKEGLKILFSVLGLPTSFAHVLRYFAVVFFAGTVWPLCFMKILNKKRK